MTAWYITWKDLRLLARDRRALTVLVLFPAILISLLGMTTSRLYSWRDENQTLELAAVNQDGGPLARQILRRLGRDTGLRVRIVESRREAVDRVQSDQCQAAVIIGPNFQRYVARLHVYDVLEPERGRLAGGLSGLDITVHTRQADAPMRSVVDRLLFSETLQSVTPIVAEQSGALAWARDAQGERQAAFHQPLPSTARLPAEAKPIRPEAKPIRPEENRLPELDGRKSQQGDVSQGEPAGVAGRGERQRGVYETLVPSYAVLFAFFLVTVMARSFIAERELGTLRRLQLAPVSSTALLVGKTAPFLTVSVLQGVFLFLFGKILFGMSWGTSPGLLVLVLFSTSVAATALGLLIATLVRTDSHVSAYVNFLVLGMAGISGCFMPRDWMPESLQQVSLLTPHAWSLVAYDQILMHQQPNLTAVLGSCTALLLFAAVFFATGWWRFKTVQKV